MSQQLIINVLGTASVDSLSIITACISENECNILDSRHALFGTDFSLTMIVSGKANCVSLLELALSRVCVEHDLLCMMKRTSGHQKQDIDQLIQLTFSGDDCAGLMQKVTSKIATCGVSVSAVRQKSTVNSGTENVQNLACKMILSAPKHIDLNIFDHDMKALLHSLGLHGQISHNIKEETHEHIESW